MFNQSQAAPSDDHGVLARTTFSRSHVKRPAFFLPSRVLSVPTQRFEQQLHLVRTDELRLTLGSITAIFWGESILAS